MMAIRDEDEIGTFDIPIFTEEFLDHNKGKCTELQHVSYIDHAHLLRSLLDVPPLCLWWISLIFCKSSKLAEPEVC